LSRKWRRIARTLQPQQLSSSTVTVWDSLEPDPDVQLREEEEKRRRERGQTKRRERRKWREEERERGEMERDYYNRSLN
jgi:hypothetical protein